MTLRDALLRTLSPVLAFVLAMGFWYLFLGELMREPGEASAINPECKWEQCR